MSHASLLSLLRIICELETADPLLVGHEEEAVYRCAVLSMAALEVGPSVENLAEFTKYPKRFVREVYERMQEAELWVEDQVRCDHWYINGKNSFDIPFWMDVLVAHGSWVREPDHKGEYSYRQVGPEPGDEILLQ